MCKIRKEYCIQDESKQEKSVFCGKIAECPMANILRAAISGGEQKDSAKRSAKQSMRYDGSKLLIVGVEEDGIEVFPFSRTSC